MTATLQVGNIGTQIVLQSTEASPPAVLAIMTIQTAREWEKKLSHAIARAEGELTERESQKIEYEKIHSRKP